MYKALSLLFGLLSLTNAAKNTTMYTCGSQEQSSSNNIAVYLALDYDAEMGYITLTGPSDQFFAVGFGATGMGGAYVIVVDGDGTVSERKLASTGAGTELTAEVMKEASKIESGVRTVLLSRALDIDNDDYYSFGAYDESSTLNLIWATAGTTSISQHSSTNRGKDNPITNFMDSDGSDASCGDLTLMGMADDDDSSAVSISIKAAFGVVLAALAALALYL